MHSFLFYLFPLSSAVMIVALILQVLLGFGGRVRSEPPFNNPPGVDIWCGKAYRATNSSFDPGGWLDPPSPADPTQLKLDLRVYSRYSYYLSTEKTATLIVDSPVSSLRGTPYKNETFDPETSPNTKIPFTELQLYVRDSAATSKPLVNWLRVPVNASGYEVEVSLEGLKSNGTTHLTVMGNSPDAIQTFQSMSEITTLPARNDTGSTARIDRLYGGISVSSSLTNNTWKPIFPYSFYTSWDWISSTINNSSATKNLTTFRQLGYNIIHIVPPGGTHPFDHTIFDQFLNICDALELYIMYDMRHTYQNNTSIATQLAPLQPHPSLLLYYTADEPDGWCDPLDATSTAYNAIRAIDQYHPISLVLNCANFYFREYTAGADIILEDTYPLILSSTFSPVYNTPCNATYGDCGCDNCHVADPAYPAYVHNAFLDILDRTENMYAYQEWIGNVYRKPVWGVPQGFFDANSFWSRWPTREEEAVMGLLRVNHGAKGIVAWIYPTSAEVESVTSELATVIGAQDVTAFLLGAERMPLETSGGDGLIDAAAWVSGAEILVIAVYQGSAAVNGTAEIKMPKAVENVEPLWGSGGWMISAEGESLVKVELEGLDASIMKAKAVGT
ncbi:hypothetical protein BU26DRAFT_460064 [Trematosphaeria pertusa]|uniref:Uncharacterized protein n=1 Tax=Trematosphaeria pertusa TaxID=390896 RepID=A0A6A6IBS9_9PLEO|nr:uncharacterized protein BU26DRAFT_460064 [Trematosphaeria pertusa]KAF2247709.1 hypothetical protein BU26DRAFT_460064 [Trematosphaeria pertusa]